MTYLSYLQDIENDGSKTKQKTVKDEPEQEEEEPKRRKKKKRKFRPANYSDADS